MGIDLSGEGGIDLAGLDLGFGAPEAAAPDPISAGSGPTLISPAPSGPHGVDLGASLEIGAGPPEGAGPLEISLELVERKPRAAPGATLGPPASAPAAPSLGDAPLAPAAPAPGAPIPVDTEASAAVAALLGEGSETAAEATRPVSLKEQVAAAAPRVRPRTMTAARGGIAVPAPAARWRPSRRLVIAGGGILLVLVAAIAALVLDLPERLRPEPEADAVLGDLDAAIAQDRASALVEGARRLEEAVSARKRAPRLRSTAAGLLAAAVVLHGGERSLVTRAQALLDAAAPAPGPAAAAWARASSWLALARGRGKEAERGLADAPLTDGDRAMLAGWAAFGRDEIGKAVARFTEATRAQPAPFPSLAAARYALARAHEAELSPAAEADYRAVLAMVPTHLGAGLGLARVSKLTPTDRLKAVQALLAKQTAGASRSELAEAHAVAARAAWQAGGAAETATALKRAREAEPAQVSLAVLLGDIALAEGRTDEALGHYRSSLAAPAGVARTPALALARVAALAAGSRGAEATRALADLDRRLPHDARVSFWRGFTAEHAAPADTVTAEREYRETLTRDPHFLPGVLQLARLLLDQKRSADALTILKDAEHEGAAPNVLKLALAQALLASGNSAEAGRQFRAVLESDANNATAHLGLAAAREGEGDLEGARSELAALGARGGAPEVGSRMAAILIKLGRREEALTAYQNDIRAGGASAVTKVAAARLALDLGRKDVARELATAAVDSDPRTPGALLVLAEVWRREGDNARALAELRRALVVDGQPEVQLEYGRALATLGRDEEALEAFAQARALPASSVERGRILLRRGDFDGAAKELASATTSSPTNAEAFLLLGQAEDRLGQVARAETAWKAAVRLAPRAPEAAYRLGRLEMDRSQTPVALPHLRAAAEHLAPGDEVARGWRPDLYFQLGFAELRQGSRDRALAAFRKYLEIAPADAPARAEVERQVHGIVP